MRGNRYIYSGKSIYNRETISRQEHRISEYRIKIQSNDSIGFCYYGSNKVIWCNLQSPTLYYSYKKLLFTFQSAVGISSYCYIWQMDKFTVWKKVGGTQQYQSHLCRKTPLILFNLQLGDNEVHTFRRGISPKVNVWSSNLLIMISQSISLTTDRVGWGCRIR